LEKKKKVKKRFNTNKAAFRISGNRLTKEYHKIGDAVSDYQLLKKIQEKYHQQKKGSWYYRALKVYENPSENTIEMEYFPAETIRRVFAKNRKSKVYYHMGMWLGILHQSTIEPGSNRVMAFSDFADLNFLLETEKKVAVGIDPGNVEQIMDHPSISIVIGAYTIQRGVLKTSKNYIKTWPAIYYYLSGYLKGCKRCALPKLREGIMELSRRKKVFWYYKKKMPFSKKIVRTGEIILLTSKLMLVSFFLRAKMYIRSDS